MSMPRICLLVTLAAACAAVDFGAPAPGLDGVTWIKGKAPVTGVVTVVEFWATWCGPCLKSIPHLTALQKRYRDQIAVVGLSDETAAEVKPFVEKQGADMDYAVGLVPAPLREKYMAGVAGIPYAVLIDAKGVVAWTGHPMSMDRPLQQVLAGTYDPVVAKQVAALEKELQALLENAQSPDQLGAALAKTTAILAIDPTHRMTIDLRLALANHLGKPDVVRSTLGGLARANLDPAHAAAVANARLEIDDLAQRHLDLAVALVEQALAKAPTDADVLAAYAGVMSEIGRLDDAIAALTKAAATAPQDARLAAAIDYYRGAKALGTKGPGAAPTPAPAPGVVP